MASLDYDTEKVAFRDFYDGNNVTLSGALESFKTLIGSLLATTPEIAISDVGGRIKDREECLNKFNLKYRTKLESEKKSYLIKDKITDLIALRIVCLYEDDVEQICNLISNEFNVLAVTDKIAQVEGTENSFGYKGLHLDLTLNEARKNMAEYRKYADHPFELQIRTVVQDSWSIIDHKIKYKKSIPNKLKRRINTLAALFELADREFCAIRDATLAEIERAKYDEIESEAEVVEEVIVEQGSDANGVKPQRNTHLDAFSFLRIARHFFPDFKFESRKVDGFTQEIVTLMPGINRGKFNLYMRNMIAEVKRYQADFIDSGGEMNPYTIMRHCLYASDESIFFAVLTDTARAGFDEWRSQKRVVNAI